VLFIFRRILKIFISHKEQEKYKKETTIKEKCEQRVPQNLTLYFYTNIKILIYFIGFMKL